METKVNQPKFGISAVRSDLVDLMSIPGIEKYSEEVRFGPTTDTYGVISASNGIKISIYGDLTRDDIDVRTLAVNWHPESRIIYKFVRKGDDKTILFNFETQEGDPLMVDNFVPDFHNAVNIINNYRNRK